MITLTLKEQPVVPLEAEILSPDVLGALEHDELRAQPVYLGKRRYRLDEFFEVEGAGGDDLEIRGDARQVKQRRRTGGGKGTRPRVSQSLAAV